MIHTQVCPMLLPNVPLTTWQMETWEARLTDDRLRGGIWWIVGEIAAAEEEEMSHTRERERAREKEKLQPLHCSLQTFTGSAISEKECVCSVTAWGVSYREIFVLYVRNALWLAILSSQGHWRRRGLAPFLVKLFCQGCVGCISPHHLAYTERLDLQKMMEFTIMSC